MNPPLRPPRLARYAVHGRAFLERFRRRLAPSAPVIAVFALAPLMVLPPHAIALPAGGQVIAGDVAAAINGAQMTLNQSSHAAIMNWQSFNIGPDEFVRVLQTGPGAAMLARVTGSHPSELLGRLQADGRFFLISPRGVLIGEGAVIDTAAFLASTLDVADADFLKQGALTFKGDGAAGIVNLGSITAREGNVFLLAHTVRNAGEISAPHGTASLGAGTEVWLASPDAPGFIVKTNLTGVPASAELSVGVDNSGLIVAAQAQLEAAGGSIYDLAINHSGAVRATGVEHRTDGRIVLTADGGNVAVTGTATARNADGSGGEILVGGDYQGSNPEVANAANTVVASTAFLDASAGSTNSNLKTEISDARHANGGRIIVWADETTRFLGHLEARGGAAGGNGGFAEVSGRRSLSFAGTADLSAPAGTAGTLLLDPDTITIVAGSTPLPAALQALPFHWDAGDDSGDQELGADTLAGLLFTNTVRLAATDTLTVNAPVVVAEGGAAGVTLELGAPSTVINESVSLAAVPDGHLSLVGHLGNSLTSAEGAMLAADSIRVGGFPIVALGGPVDTASLSFNMFAAATSFTATHPGNAIGEIIMLSDPADPEPVDFTGNVSVHSGAAMEISALIGSANNVTFSAAGDLTARGDTFGLPATEITASGAIKLAAASGGVFINEAGAGVLQGTGRRLIYTSDTDGGFSLGGLAGYEQFDGVPFPDDPETLVTLVLYNAAGGAPVLTLTITANDFMKLYGQPNPVFSASFAGGTSGDLTVQPEFMILEEEHVNVGTYTIVPFGAASNTHNLEYVNGRLIINPATLIYIAEPANRLYGDTNPAFSGTVTGFVAGDTLESATAGTLTFTSPATPASDAGAHAVLGDGLTANHGNYVFEQALANFSALTIGPAPLVVTIDDATRVYGASNPAFSATFSGFVNDDTVDVVAGFAPGADASAASPVGTYLIGSIATAPNYAITVVPGTLTVEPAPLTLVARDVTVPFGGGGGTTDGFDVVGLQGSDTPDVVTGALLTPIFVSNDAPPGTTFPITFMSPGAAENYTITTVPGTLTVGRASYVFAVPDLTTLAGAVPATFSLNAPAPLLGGPQFNIVAVAPGVDGSSPPGAYALLAAVAPASTTSLAEIETFYDFSFSPGVLTVEPAPVNSTVLNFVDVGSAEISLIIPDAPIDIVDPEDFRDVFDVSAEGVVTGSLAEPLSPWMYSRAALDFGDELLNFISIVLEDQEKKVELTEGQRITLEKQGLEFQEDRREFALEDEQLALLKDLQDGKITVAQLSAMAESDPLARAVIMPLLALAIMSALDSGAPLTPPQEIMVARITDRMTEYRQILSAELAEQKREFEINFAESRTLNQYAFKSMPDIAISAQQAATEKAIAAAIGVGIGSTVGGALAIPLATSATVAKAIMPNVAKMAASKITQAGKTAIMDGVVPAKLTQAQVSAISAKAAKAAGLKAAGAVFAVAVGVIVVGIVSAVLIDQEERNINAFEEMVERANTPVNPKLSGFDLANNDHDKADFYAAFMMMSLETGFKQ